MNPWTIEGIITHAKAMAERNGFELHWVCTNINLPQ